MGLKVGNVDGEDFNGEGVATHVVPVGDGKALATGQIRHPQGIGSLSNWVLEYQNLILSMSDSFIESLDRVEPNVVILLTSWLLNFKQDILAGSRIIDNIGKGEGTDVSKSTSAWNEGLRLVVIPSKLKTLCGAEEKNGR